MMVTFISQCEKNALKRTRRVLDAFANRIGDNTWQTVITQEGLLAVKKLLRKTASKNTAVSCHWIRSRSRTELVWVVGNKFKFNPSGLVPVNSTNVSRNYEDTKADWHYLPLIRALAALAALLHDWGKANARFQAKLFKRTKGQSDPLRHEWVSCLLLKMFVLRDESNWLERLMRGEINEPDLSNTNDLCRIEKPLDKLPPTAQLLAWLIITHHRLPTIFDRNKRDNDWARADISAPDLPTLLAYIEADWGYQNLDAGVVQACLQFDNGLLSESSRWLKEIKRWARKLLEQQNLIETVINDGSVRIILHHARLCLMLGDHYYSSLPPEKTGNWNNTSGLIANTNKDHTPRQALDQHLLGVYEAAKKNVQLLPRFEAEAPVSRNVGQLRKLSPTAFRWQDTAVKQIKTWQKDHVKDRYGFFAVNMASTGCGKTFANAKVMKVLSDDSESLRFTLALGLRTLTLQTGDEYKQRVFQTENTEDLAVLIGSRAIAELHDQKKQDEPEPVDFGSESAEQLLPPEETVIADCDIPQEGLATVLRSDKEKQFLFAPVLVCTIDHIMAATETTRGGRYILPCLRLLSADLVIDEIDDFTGSDLIAIGRLIHLAGMLGRKVMISSATIPPALAEGYFHAYRLGWRLFSKTRSASSIIGCAWIDEFQTRVTSNSLSDRPTALQQYLDDHQAFILKRIAKLQEQLARRKASVIECDLSAERTSLNNPTQTLQQIWFSIIAKAAIDKHIHHHTVDAVTGLTISFGAIRIANIQPCVALTRFFLDHSWPEGIAVRTMAYHSQQVLLMRHAQERHLDAVLKRKENSGEQPKAFSDPVIRRHIDSAIRQGQQHLLFILVATPVEEVGRDHDFDWTIIEPSSYRSIVQMAGRVKRHRLEEATNENVGLLQYNWKTVEGGNKPWQPYFSGPGYESKQRLSSGKTACCKTHDLSRLLDVNAIYERLDASPRITLQGKESLFRLAALEHAVIADQLTNYDRKSAAFLEGYLSQLWYLTGLPQAFHRFRASEPTTMVYLYLNDKINEPIVVTKDNEGKMNLDITGEPLPRDDTESYCISFEMLTPEQQSRLWLTRNYRELLQEQAEINGMDLSQASLRYGELTLREYKATSKKVYSYIDQIGLYKKKETNNA